LQGLFSNYKEWKLQYTEFGKLLNNFFDIQVNGYAGIDFNSPAITADALYHACTQLKKDGVQGILVTIITAEPDYMIKCLQNINNIREQENLFKEMIYGFHIEGPFLNINPGYRGTHNPAWIKNADIELMKKLLEAASGLTRIVTLAPEVDGGFRVTKMLAENNIVVSAGHCDTSLEQLNAAIDNGLSMFTHLGNGCPSELPRHDNIIQRVLSLKDKLWISFISDGLHIPLFILKNYLAVTGYTKVIITTDAMAAASAKPGVYTLGSVKLEVGRDKIVREPGKNNFAGSSITMRESSRLLQDILNISREKIKRLMSVNPLKVIK
jgi:N-acetylglucosamine-6-phosphate deacetylase